MCPDIVDVVSVDPAHRAVQTMRGSIPYDVLVVAPGATERSSGVGGHSLRSFSDAFAFGCALRQLAAQARCGTHGRVVITCGGAGSWTAPMCELSLLVSAWLRASGLHDRISVALSCESSEVFPYLGPEAATIVAARLEASRIRTIEDPVADLRELGEAVLRVHAPPLRARAIPGLADTTEDGWYAVDDHQALSNGVYVIGDATTCPVRAAFATTWQARRILSELRGEGGTCATTTVQYQMDLGDAVLRVELLDTAVPMYPDAVLQARTSVEFGATPHKLEGTLLHDEVLAWHPGADDAPTVFRSMLACGGNRSAT